MKKVLAGGRFNILHPGHIFFLKKCKSLGDQLVVVVASDKTIKRAGKPLLSPQKERKFLVSAIKAVDKVVIGYSISRGEGYQKLIKKERPDIIALGHDQQVNPAALKALAKKEGISCKVVRIKKYREYQTSTLFKKIK